MSAAKLFAMFVAALATLIVVSYGAYRYGVSGRSDSSQIGASTQAGESIDPKTGKRVLYWHDPMVPGQRFDKPGKSPFMDMELAPVYADDAIADAGISIDPSVQQRLGVRSVAVEKRSLGAAFTVVGNVEYNERDVVDLQARAAGYVERVYARTPMQNVNAGQKLADLYVPEWVATQEDYLAIRRMQSGDTESLQAAALQRMRLVGMTDDQIAAVSEARVVQPRISIRAPIAGVVTELNARDGMSVTNGATLFRINGLKTVWLYAEVPEAALAAIEPGIAVVATATALPNTELHGRVLEVLPNVSGATRTAKARIELQNPKRLLLPGMFVTVRLLAEPRSDALVVPSEAIIATGMRNVVIVATDGGRFVPTDVETGIESDGVTEIRAGLQEGQQVVASAQFLIDSEASLKATTDRMNAGAMDNTMPPASAPQVDDGRHGDHR